MAAVAQISPHPPVNRLGLLPLSHGAVGNLGQNSIAHRVHGLLKLRLFLLRRDHHRALIGPGHSARTGSIKIICNAVHHAAGICNHSAAGIVQVIGCSVPIDKPGLHIADRVKEKPPAVNLLPAVRDKAAVRQAVVPARIVKHPSAVAVRKLRAHPVVVKRVYISIQGDGPIRNHPSCVLAEKVPFPILLIPPELRIAVLVKIIPRPVRIQKPARLPAPILIPIPYASLILDKFPRQGCL